MKLAFDLETAAVISDGEDWRSHRPLGVICAATLAADEETPTLHFSRDENGECAERMTPEDLRRLVVYLQQKAQDGYEIVTWNGLAFDFDVLAEESGMFEECAALALDHIDMMFHVFCLRNHYLGLNKAAKGMGLAGKTEGMSGKDAPRLWAEGRRQEVLDYLAQDVCTTLLLAEIVEFEQELRWFSNAGRFNVIAIPRWLTVAEAMQLPLPDVSWMINPPARENLFSWLRQGATDERA